MNRERNLIASVIKSRKAYSDLVEFVVRDDLSEQGWTIWQKVCDYYGADAEAKHVDVDILVNSVARTVAADKHKTMFENIIRNLAELDVSTVNVVRDLLITKQDNVGQRLANSLLSNEDSEGLVQEYMYIHSKTALISEEQEDARNGMSVEELINHGFSDESMVQVYPLALNERLDGNVKPGHHLVLFARPEMGKTMMTIEMMAGFAIQGLRVLYIGNEDPIDDINMRIINRLSGMPKVEVFNRPAVADQQARENGYDNIILKGMSPGTPREITHVIEKYKPHVLVLDQIRNLDMGIENYVLKMEAAATQARNWAKKYSMVVVSVTQAGDSATNKSILQLGDVDYSNTGIPSQADVMIGIGASADQQNKNEIVISLPKNKVSGRHDYFACQTEPQLSKITSF